MEKLYLKVVAVLQLCVAKGALLNSGSLIFFFYIYFFLFLSSSIEFTDPPLAYTACALWSRPRLTAVSLGSAQTL